MARRKNNPTPLAVVATLAVVGVGGYLAFEHMAKAKTKKKSAIGGKTALQPWDEGVLPGDETLVDRGEFVGRYGRTQWRFYQAPLGPGEEYFLVLFRTPTDTGMDTVATMDDARAWIQEHLS